MADWAGSWASDWRVAWLVSQGPAYVKRQIWGLHRAHESPGRTLTATSCSVPGRREAAAENRVAGAFGPTHLSPAFCDLRNLPAFYL